MEVRGGEHDISEGWFFTTESNGRISHRVDVRRSNIIFASTLHWEPS
jgi:hypothetical protein